jgi:hypothetical protein
MTSEIVRTVYHVRRSFGKVSNEFLTIPSLRFWIKWIIRMILLGLSSRNRWLAAAYHAYAKNNHGNSVEERYIQIFRAIARWSMNHDVTSAWHWAITISSMELSGNMMTNFTPRLNIHSSKPPFCSSYIRVSLSYSLSIVNHTTTTF